MIDQFKLRKSIGCSHKKSSLYNFIVTYPTFRLTPAGIIAQLDNNDPTILGYLKLLLFSIQIFELI